MRGKRSPRHLTSGKRLREERERQGLTLRALAESAGVSKSTLNMIELERHSASMAVIEAVAKALAVSPAWLAFGMGPREPPPLHFRKKAAQLAEWLDALEDKRGSESAAMLRSAYGGAGKSSEDELG